MLKYKTADAKREKSDSDKEYFEPDEEELEEERLDAAAKRIQGLFRARRARRTVRELAKANYVKEIDPLTREFVYKNRRTGRISLRKPVGIYGIDDLETPRIFAQPGEYDPGLLSQSSLPPQFALVITNRVFDSPKIPDIPSQVEGDHDALREVLEHPYFCKFLPENCFFFKNANFEVFVAALASFSLQVSATMKRLENEWKGTMKTRRKEQKARSLEVRLARRTAKEAEDIGVDLRDNSQSGGVEHPEKDSQDTITDKDTTAEEDEEFDSQEASLFVYICTHSAEITKDRGIAGSYLLASDTSWKSKEQVARTAVSLETFAEAIARIQVRHKTVFLDVVHTAKESGGFKARHLYPSRELYDNAARLSGAVVVGSCRIGGTREVDLDVLLKEAEAVWAIADPKDGGGGNRAEGRSCTCGAGSNGNVFLELGDGDRDGSTDANASWNGSDSNLGSTREDSGGCRTIDAGARVHQAVDSGRERGVGCDGFRSGGKLVGSSPSRRNPRVLIVGVDNDDTKGDARGRGRRQRSSGFALKGVTGGREVLLRGDDATRPCEPVYDRAMYGEEKSVFGGAVRDALVGECIEGSGTASRVLMAHLYNFVVWRLDSFERLPPRRARSEEWFGGDPDQRTGFRKEKAAAEVKAKQTSWWRRHVARSAAQVDLTKEREAGQSKDINSTEGFRVTQAPVIVGPSVPAIARATVCAAPSPPPPPQTPFAVEVSRDYVRLAWDDSVDFAGAPPISYQLEQRGSLRNNGTWEPVFPPWYPAVVSQTVKVPQRVPGLGLQYRVRACNLGGWGAFSNPTGTITTKPWLANWEGATSRAMRTLARAGGARLVLERMRRYSSSLLVQESGFHQLIAEFNNGEGITRASLAREVAMVVADAMTAFSQVRKIQASGLLLLGWAARGKGGGGPMPQDIVERCLELVAAAEKLHSMDATVKGSALWARSNLNSTRGNIPALCCASSEGFGTRIATLTEDTGAYLVDTTH